MTSEIRAVIAWISIVILHFEYWIPVKSGFLGYLTFSRQWHWINIRIRRSKCQQKQKTIMGTYNNLSYMLVGLLLWLEKPECGMPTFCVLLFCATWQIWIVLFFLGTLPSSWVHDESWRICYSFLMLLISNWQLIWHSCSWDFSFKESPLLFSICGNQTPSGSTKKCCSPTLHENL